MYEVRASRYGDEDLLMEFLLSLPKETLKHWHPFGKTFNLEDFVKLFQQSLDFKIICLDNGKIVSFGHLTECNEGISLGIVSLEKRKGYGGEVMKRLLNIARHLGYFQIVLTVYKDNSEAIKFFEQYDFLIDKDCTPETYHMVRN